MKTIYRDFLNMKFMQDIPLIEGYPLVKKEEYIEKEFISFNKCLSTKNTDKNVHFFIDDYQFERCWREPNRYVNLLKRFNIVLSPDFSIYTDMPKPLQIFNHFRKQFLSAYWQLKGVHIIPTICWGHEETFDFCFKGIEKRGVVAISTLGSKRHLDSFYKGFHQMLKEIEPKKILVYGDCKGVFLECPAKIINVKCNYKGEDYGGKR